MLDCVLISSDEAFRHAVMGIIGQPTNHARLALDLPMVADGLDREKVAKVIKANPNVVFLDLGVDPSGVGGIQMLTQEAPGVALVVGGPALSAEGLLAVMRAGASEYLPHPFSQKDALEAFLRIQRRAKASNSDQPAVLGKVLTVFSAKGGTGVTTIATNLAVALRSVTGKAVLLLDLAPALGTAAVAMGVHPRYTYVDVIQNFHRIDEELFRSFLEVDDSGVHVLSAPLSPAGTDMPMEDEIHGLIELCRQQFDFVVIDGGSRLSNHLGPLLHDSDHRILVVTQELPTLRNLKQALDLHGRTNGNAPPQLVLNQFREGVGLSSRDVEDGLGHPVAVVIGRDYARVLQSINVGRPEVQNGKSRFSKNLIEFARKLAGPDNLTVSRKGLFSRLRRPAKTSGQGGEEAK